MKSAVMTCFSALVALSMTGCPIYPADDLCRSDWDCAPGYLCDRTLGACVLAGPLHCARPSDCGGPSEVCGREGLCVVGSCHLSNVGCVAGYTCMGSSPDQAWACVPTGTPSGVGGAYAIDAGTTGGVTTAGSSSSEPTDAE
jgi:hypothetical protein